MYIHALCYLHVIPYLYIYIYAIYHVHMQVLSESVAKTTEWYNERSTQTRDTRATEQFVLLMDRFFDMLNVRGLTEGKRTRKAT